MLYTKLVESYPILPLLPPSHWPQDVIYNWPTDIPLERARELGLDVSSIVNQGGPGMQLGVLEDDAAILTENTTRFNFEHDGAAYTFAIVNINGRVGVVCTGMGG